VVVPVRPGVGAPGELPLAMFAQGFDAERGQGYGALGILGLGLDKLHLPAKRWRAWTISSFSPSRSMSAQRRPSSSRAAGRGTGPGRRVRGAGVRWLRAGPRGRPRRDSNPPVSNHAGLAQVYAPAGLDHGDLDDGLAKRDRAENVDRDAADPKWPLDRLVDHVGKKGSRRPAVLGRAVPRALSGPGRLVSPVPAGQVIGLGFF
jgi:hypothetical protein